MAHICLEKVLADSLQANSSPPWTAPNHGWILDSLPKNKYYKTWIKHGASFLGKKNTFSSTIKTIMIKILQPSPEESFTNYLNTTNMPFQNPLRNASRPRPKKPRWPSPFQTKTSSPRHQRHLHPGVWSFHNYLGSFVSASSRCAMVKVVACYRG